MSKKMGIRMNQGICLLRGLSKVPFELNNNRAII